MNRLSKIVNRKDISKLKSIIRDYNINIEYHNGFNEYDPETNTVFISTCKMEELLKWCVRRSDITKYWSVAHEIGHAVFYCKDIGFKKRARKIFGDFDLTYEGAMGLLKSAFYNEDDPDYVTFYAMSHPEEDFAETFAYVIIHKNIGMYEHEKGLQKKIDYIINLLKK